jgi:hypothetical protein
VLDYQALTSIILEQSLMCLQLSFEQLLHFAGFSFRESTGGISGRVTHALSETQHRPSSVLWGKGEIRDRYGYDAQGTRLPTSDHTKKIYKGVLTELLAIVGGRNHRGPKEASYRQEGPLERHAVGKRSPNRYVCSFKCFFSAA